MEPEMDAYLKQNKANRITLTYISVKFNTQTTASKVKGWNQKVRQRKLLLLINVRNIYDNYINSPV